MAEFLSDDWFAALSTQASDTSTDPTITITLQQTVESGEPIIWHTTISEGTVRVTRGATDSADVRLRCDLATAAAIHDGSISAQRAFLDGSLRIDGDLVALMAARESLADIDLFGAT